MAEIGVVKFFNTEKGFGFIQRESAPDVFVHKVDLKATGLSHLTEGQRVHFDLLPGREGKGPKAANVKIGMP